MGGRTGWRGAYLRTSRAARGIVSELASQDWRVHVRDDLAFANADEHGFDAARARGRPFPVDDAAWDQDEVAGLRLDPVATGRTELEHERTGDYVQVGVGGG